MIETTTRNATLQDLAAMLQSQGAHKLDVVAPAASLRSEGGLLHVAGTRVAMDENGVTTTDGVFRPTDVFDEGVSDKLGIPRSYLRKMRDTRPDLYDANVNGWLHGLAADATNGDEGVAGDKRSFFVRTFQSDEDEVGVARALMSDRYSVIDNFDVLTATLSGIKAAGVPVQIDKSDLTDRRMYVHVRCEEIAALAPDLLRGYRSPFGGGDGTANPTVFAGLVVSNSEVGAGAFSITPRLIVEVCSNGMTVNKDAMRAVHTGSKLEAGVVKWSAETQQKSLELITSRTADAVRTFLDVDYMRKVIAEITADASVEIPASEAATVVETVAKKLLFTQEQQDGILGHFIQGGQLTAGGVMHAVTSYAQTVDDADTAHELERSGMRVLALAAGK